MSGPSSAASPEGVVHVSVRLFAILRDAAGTDAMGLTLDRGSTVGDALTQLRARPGLRETLERLPVGVAVNREYATSATVLREQDELALIPPLSGGAPSAPGVGARIHVRVGADPPRVQACSREVSDARAGAVVIFVGVTREVPALEYEAYEEMARERIELILRECAAEHGLLAAAAEHRVGTVELGTPSVVVAASAPHRAEAFAGAREAIDRIKQEAPIWKRERTDAGESWVEGTPAPGAVPAPSARRLTHLDSSGSARMVDVGAKRVTERVARARARVRMSPESARAVAAGDGPKGEVLGTARLAGIQAAKRTADLIPLAHPLALTFVDVEAGVEPHEGIVELTSEVRTSARTGVEMEAMTACAVAALTVYDMTKGLERGVEIERVVLLEKRGGRGDYARPRDPVPAQPPAGRAPTARGAQAAGGGGGRALGAAVLTVSTSKAAGEGKDRSGALLADLARRLGAEVLASELVSDDRSRIEERLRHWAADPRCALVLSTGGTGVSPSDVTPEATVAVVEREIPGIGEAMRAASRPHTSNWMLSRGIAGVRSSTLIVNFPGSPASVEQLGEALLDPLAHALALTLELPAGH